MLWKEDSNEKKSRVNKENILEFIRKKYPHDAHMMEIHTSLKMDGNTCNREYILNHIKSLLEEDIIAESSSRGWRLNPLGETKGTRILLDNKETELAVMPIGQQPMSGEPGTVWIEVKDNQGLSHLELKYNNETKSIPISGQESFRSSWDVNLGDDKLPIWGKPIIAKSQVFIRCYVTLKLAE